MEDFWASILHSPEHYLPIGVVLLLLGVEVLQFANLVLGLFVLPEGHKHVCKEPFPTQNCPGHVFTGEFEMFSHLHGSV